MRFITKYKLVDNLYDTCEDISKEKIKRLICINDEIVIWRRKNNVDFF